MIEFYNPGKLYGDISIADLLSNNYSSKVRNKLIARAFKESGIIEKYGSGIKRVFDICNDHGVIPPKFEEIFNGFKVTLFKTKSNVTDNVTDNRTINILNKINLNNKISIDQLAEILKVTRRTIIRDLEILKNQNVIKRIGPDKGGYWEIIKLKVKEK